MALKHRIKRVEQAANLDPPLLVSSCAKGHPYQPIPADFKGHVIRLLYGHCPCKCQTNGSCTSSSLTVS